MGSIGTLFAATLVAVTYGWMPASSDDNGESTSASEGYEYLVQVGAEDLRALAEGRVSSLSSATPEGMKSIDRVRIVFGEGELPRQLTAVDRTSPKRLAKLSQTAVRHTVAKPIVSDWLPVRDEALEEQGGQRHTVYQQPGYTNPGSLGDEVVRRNEAMQRGFTDALRNAPKDLGNYADRTVRDLAQGTRGVVEGAYGGLHDSVQAGAQGLGNAANNTVNLGNQPYFDQRGQEQNRQSSQANGTGTGTQSPYKPFSYNDQPTLAEQANSQDSHAGHNHAGHNHTPNTNLDRQPIDNRGQGPALPNATGRTAADSGIATTFADTNSQSNDQGFRINDVDRGNGDFRDTYRNDYRDYERSNNAGTYNNRGQLVDQRDDGRMTPVARDTTRQGSSERPLGQGPLDEFGSRRDDSYRNPSRSGSFDNWDPQTVDNRRLAAPDFGTPSSFGTPPLTPQQPATQTTGFGTPNQNQGASPGVVLWRDAAANNNAPNYNPSNSPNGGAGGNSANNGINKGGQQTASLGNDLWVNVFLAISIFGNLYVVTSYLDVRNKYRSALRQSPRGYQPTA